MALLKPLPENVITIKEVPMAETTREVVNDMKSLGKQAIDTGKGAMHEAKSEL